MLADGSTDVRLDRDGMRTQEKAGRYLEAK